MIAMSLIAIVVIYLLIFLIVGFKSPNWTCRLIIWGIMLAPVIWKTWDIPVGQYKFKKLCEKEAGIKIYVQNPKPATRIRLEGSEMGASAAEHFLLRNHLKQIESADRKYNFVSDPIAYALYERDEKGKIVSKLMDKVDDTGTRTRVTYSEPSKAEYFLSFEKKEYPYRVNLERFTLRSANNTVISTATRIYYTWSKAENTILGQSFNLFECGCQVNDDKKLINLIAQPKEIKIQER